jgi:hypothetical protein
MIGKVLNLLCGWDKANTGAAQTIGVGSTGYDRSFERIEGQFNLEVCDMGIERSPVVRGDRLNRQPFQLIKPSLMLLSNLSS